jgi:hypothetical protein
LEKSGRYLLYRLSGHTTNLSSQGYNYGTGVSRLQKEEQIYGPKYRERERHLAAAQRTYGGISIICEINKLYLNGTLLKNKMHLYYIMQL